MERLVAEGCIRCVRSVVVAFIATASLAGCSTQPPESHAPASSPEPRPDAVATFAASPATTFEEIRTRPIRTPSRPRSGCPVSKKGTVHFPDGTEALANGTAPFSFGPWDNYLPTIGDGNKTPWRVELGYAGRILVRGKRIDGTGDVAFGFWPQGFGTPAETPGVPVVFKRTDSQGRTTVYQPELDIAAPAGGRGDGHLWSFPARGCYAIQADGDEFTHVTIISIA